jgi:hypothetical protein
MGHGLGQQQREILAALKRRRRNRLMTTSELATALGGDTPSRRESVRQALHALHQRGLVELQHLPEEHDLSDARLDQLGRYGVAARPVHLCASLPERL